MLHFLQPKIKLSDLENSVKLVTYTSDFINTFYINIKELFNHFTAISYDVNEVQKVKLFPIFTSLDVYQTEIEALILDNTSATIYKFQALQYRLIVMIQNLQTFIDDNGISDKSIGDISIEFK